MQKYDGIYIQLVLLVDIGTSCISVFNDGSSRDLMSLTGTVPVSYRGKECFSLTKQFSLFVSNTKNNGIIIILLL